MNEGEEKNSSACHQECKHKIVEIVDQFEKPSEGNNSFCLL